MSRPPEPQLLKEKKPVLSKADKYLGLAYFCTHCKTLQCTGKGPCTKCGGEIDWSKRVSYEGEVYWN